MGLFAFAIHCDLRFGDFPHSKFAARSLPDETQLRCQATTVRATWQVSRVAAVEIFRANIARCRATFDAELT